MTNDEYYNIYRSFVDIINKNRDKFNNFYDVSFLLNPLKDIKVRDGYLLDAYPVTYIREGAYYFQLYICREDADTAYHPKLTDIRDSFWKKLNVQKCEKQWLPKYNDSMYIDTEIPSELEKDIPCDQLVVPFTEKGIWEALMLKIAYMHLPKFDHGAYKESRLILCDKDVSELVIHIAIDNMEWYVGKEKVNRIENGVSINGNCAEVKYTYWNDWQGLVKVTTKAYKDGDGIRWDDNSTKETIYFF